MFCVLCVHGPEQRTTGRFGEPLGRRMSSSGTSFGCYDDEDVDVYEPNVRRTYINLCIFCLDSNRNDWLGTYCMRGSPSSCTAIMFNRGLY